MIGETGKVWGSEFTAKVVGQYTQLALDWFSKDCYWASDDQGLSVPECWLREAMPVRVAPDSRPIRSLTAFPRRCLHPWYRSVV